MPAPPPSGPPPSSRQAGGESSPDGDSVSPVGEAFAWASRILAIGLAMFLPGVGGNWLDARFGTRFLGPAGLVFGFTAAIVWLVQIGNSVKPYRRRGGTTRHRIPPEDDEAGKGRGHA